MDCKVLLLFSPSSSSNPALSRFVVSRKMKEIKKRVDKIAAQRSKFHFSVGPSSDEQLEVGRRETFSELDKNYETTIIAREEEKEELIRLVLEAGDEEEISIIPIVGLGGLGKTTIAKLVYNDDRVKAAFNLQAWVYVSQKFDLGSIGKSLIKEAKESCQNMDNLQDVSQKLEQILKYKKFLVVLDDLWEEDGTKLEELKVMLQAGKQGSKIIVTTRKKMVATQICAAKPYCLKLLTDDDCWVLFSQKAFRSGVENAEARFVEIGKEIVKKCGGVPLAAKSIGYMMRTKDAVDSWLAVKDSNMWELEDDHVLSSLKLNYYNMSSTLKLCFAYCAMFPKGCAIYEEDLIQHWISLGFFKSMLWSLAMEKKGKSSIIELLGMSFLQYSQLQSRVLHMHDLVYDLARSVAGDDILVLNTINRANADLGRHHCRYAFVGFYDCDRDSSSKSFKALPSKVRALHLKVRSKKHLPKNIFTLSKCLRVLDLSGSSIEELPTSITQLKQLNYLNASKLPIKTLPVSFGDLINLQILNLSETLLEVLPVSVCKLRKLCYLNLQGCSQLRSLCESINKLQLLQKLNLSNTTSFQELPSTFGDLCKLQVLHLSGCSQMKKLPESTGNLKELIYLDLSGCSQLDTLPTSFRSHMRLNFLDLSDCENLKELPDSVGNLTELEILNIENCRSLSCLPNGVCKMTNLKQIKGHDGIWETFPLGIEHLVHLQTLPIYVVRTKARENGTTCSSIVELELLNKLHRKLEILGLENVQSPEDAERAKLYNKAELRLLILEWSECAVRHEENVVIDEAVLDKLRPHGNLRYIQCEGYRGRCFPKWVIDLPSSLPNLVQVKLCNLPNCVGLPLLGQLPNLEILEIHTAPSICKVDLDFSRGGFQKLRELSLSDMVNLEGWSVLQSSPDEKHLIFPNLRKTCISRCPKLFFEPSFPRSREWIIVESSRVLSSNAMSPVFPDSQFSKMYVRGCSVNLDGWNIFRNLSTLESLVIEHCKDLITLPKGLQGLMSLNSLSILNCTNFVALPEWLGQLASLKELYIRDCWKLRSLPQCMQQLTALKTLRIINCSKELLKQCSNNEHSKISHIRNVVIERYAYSLLNRLLIQLDLHGSSWRYHCCLYIFQLVED